MAGKGAAWKTTSSLAKTTATRSSRSRLLRIPRKAKRGPTTTRRPSDEALGAVALDRGLELVRALEPVALAQPFEHGFERLFVRDRGGDPAVAADVARGPHVGQQVGDLTFVCGQLERHVHGPALDDGPAEHLVVADLEDRKIAPRPVLVGLRKGEGQLRDPLRDRLQPHGRILAVSDSPGRASQM